MSTYYTQRDPLGLTYEALATLGTLMVVYLLEDAELPFFDRDELEPVKIQIEDQKHLEGIFDRRSRRECPAIERIVLHVDDVFWSVYTKYKPALGPSSDEVLDNMTSGFEKDQTEYIVDLPEGMEASEPIPLFSVENGLKGQGDDLEIVTSFEKVSPDAGPFVKDDERGTPATDKATIHGISVRQPFAEAVIAGKQKVLLREHGWDAERDFDWILIHAGPDRPAAHTVHTMRFQWKRAPLAHEYPLDMILGVAKVSAVVPVEVGEGEKMWAWHFDGALPFTTRAHLKAAPGLWDPPADLQEAYAGALETALKDRVIKDRLKERGLMAKEINAAHERLQAEAKETIH